MRENRRKRERRSNKARKNQAPQLKAADYVVLELWVRAGGRCEFHGCNDYLLQDKLTTNYAKLADIAHIVARSKDGPRGDDPLPLTMRNKIDNLFLACTKHHRMIDKKTLVSRYPKDILIYYKKEHEERIRFTTGLSSEHETTVLRLSGDIRGNTVSISAEEIREAVLKCGHRYPRYLGGENNIEIDLRGLHAEDPREYWNLGFGQIRNVVTRLLVPGIQDRKVRHLSIFALARIPFLVYLGHMIGDKVPVEIYQKHRNGSEAWIWPEDRSHRFVVEKIASSNDKSNVAILLSISGRVLKENLPQLIASDFNVFSISPAATAPGRMIVSSKETLQRFRETYANLLRTVERDHPSANKVHVFPAVPISIGLTLARELLRNVSPKVIIYDKVKIGYDRVLEVDPNKWE